MSEIQLLFVNKGEMVDEATRKQLASIPLLKTKAGPRDGELWVQRLKEEYQSLIKVQVESMHLTHDTVSCYTIWIPVCDRKWLGGF